MYTWVTHKRCVPLNLTVRVVCTSYISDLCVNPFNRTDGKLVIVALNILRLIKGHKLVVRNVSHNEGKKIIRIFFYNYLNFPSFLANLVHKKSYSQINEKCNSKNIKY